MVSEIFGVQGIIVVLVIVAVLFGSAAIPKLARNLGSARKEFERGLESPAGGDPAAAEPGRSHR